jgi:hypothetical protein
MSACSGGGSGSSSTSASDGPILVQQVSASGRFEDTLRITGLSGQGGSIHIPGPSVGLGTGVPGKALYPTDTHRVYLVDAIRKSATRLSIPGTPAVVPNPAVFGQSDRFVVLGSPNGSPAYLVDAQAGAATNLTDLGLSKTAFGGEFSPDGSHYVFTGDNIVLVPTADPKAATRLGPDKAGFAGFTTDGKRLAYVELSDPQHPTAVIEDVAGGGRQTVHLPGRVFRARLLGDGDRMLLEREGKLSLLDVQTGKETTILSPGTLPALVWFAPSGRAALVGTRDSPQGPTSWTWLDLEKGAARALPSLAGDAPILSSIADPLLFFSDGRLPGKARSFSVLDLETGQGHHVFSFPKPRLVAGQSIASGGRFALLPVQDEGGGGELWLVPAEGGKPRRIAGSTGGIAGMFSPSGDWVAVAEVSRGSGGSVPTAGIVAVSTQGNEVRDLGEGVAPVWLRG